MKKEEDEAQLFLDAVKDVKRLEHGVAEVSSRPVVPVTRRVTSRHAEPSDDVAPTNENTFIRTGIQTNVLRKLRNGNIPIEGALDLHGRTSREAEEEIRGFLASARGSGKRAVRIIHGKGFGSPGGKSVLKAKTQQWLRENEAVLAFCPAGPENGGDGALHVLLKKGTGH